MIPYDGEDEWVAHELAGHTHQEEVLVWDEALGNAWPAELRCKDCNACRYLTRAESVKWLARHNVKSPEWQSSGWIGDPTWAQ
jgi:hypothetical protein